MTTFMEPRLLMAEDYLRLPDNGVPTELVQGRTVEKKRPDTSHPYFCMRVVFYVAVRRTTRTWPDSL
jgi:hypothetical protein